MKSLRGWSVPKTERRIPSGGTFSAVQLRANDFEAYEVQFLMASIWSLAWQVHKGGV
jgi:hypothetical protein